MDENKRRGCATQRDLTVMMMEIKLEPSLTHCIETTAKREYERVLGQLLKGKEEDSQLAEELELLRIFLESADFGQLRSRCDDSLTAGKGVEARLTSSSSAPGYEIEIVEIDGA
ncbi:MAG TPA: hypothetical protein PKJ17_03675 [Syntrophorhabdaceae bacterium]|nr:hypothetical protein [Syntrophorhabdaceae bacterium]